VKQTAAGAFRTDSSKFRTNVRVISMIINLKRSAREALDSKRVNRMHTKLVATALFLRSSSGSGR
jgi:hypothetical protein